MEGCSKYCSFCVVPYTRGEEVSRPFDDVLTEVADLADQGVKEITLLGQNVNAYRGAMGPGAQAGGETADFATLLEYRRRDAGLERIRYTTSHPKRDDAAPDRRATRRFRKLVSHLHLPVQSGSDRVLARDEARLHGARIQVDRAQAARDARPELSLTSDFIVGFPGETRRGFRADDEARRGNRLRRRVQLHLQPAARNAGGRAARTRYRVRSRRRGWRGCRRCSTRNTACEASAWSGRASASWSPAAPPRISSELAARTDNNRVVNFAGDASLIGSYADVTITAALRHSLRGELPHPALSAPAHGQAGHAAPSSIPQALTVRAANMFQRPRHPQPACAFLRRVRRSAGQLRERAPPAPDAAGAPKPAAATDGAPRLPRPPPPRASHVRSPT